MLQFRETEGSSRNANTSFCPGAPILWFSLYLEEEKLHLLGVCCVPGIIRNALNVLSHLYLTTLLQGRYCYEETGSDWLYATKLVVPRCKLSVTCDSVT